MKKSRSYSTVSGALAFLPTIALICFGGHCERSRHGINRAAAKAHHPTTRSAQCVLDRRECFL